MLSFAGARQAVLAELDTTPPVRLPLSACSGMVLAEPYHARNDSPPFDASSVDGFAVLASDLTHAQADKPIRLPVVATTNAGDATVKKFDKSTTVRIMTGAPVPDGADAVVPFENATCVEDGVAFTQKVRKGDHLRPSGDDFRKGALLVSANSQLNHILLGLLASAGVAQVAVYSRPRVALISSGHELAEMGSVLRPSKIHDANTPMLRSAIERHGGEVTLVEKVGDSVEEVKSALQRAAEQSDLVVSSGGVSVGDRDYLRAAVTKINFWQVAMRPGRQLMFGVCESLTGRQTPILGLPGNPVSALVTFEQFVRPAIRLMRGLPAGRLPRVKAIAEERIDSSKNLQTYARVTVSQRDGRWHAHLVGNQSSGALGSLAVANGLAVCPVGLAKIEVGSYVWVELFLRDSETS